MAMLRLQQIKVSTVILTRFIREVLNELRRGPIFDDQVRQGAS
jgi:hypothetical protein